MRTRLSTLCLFLTLSSISTAGEPAVTDEKEAAKDPDFAVQGEYTGEIAGQKTGVQLVAKGKGKFQIVAYGGGLPGDGWGGVAAGRIRGEATTHDGKVTATLDGLAFTLTDGKLVTDHGTLTRVERESPTMGMTPPAGARYLFDGKDTKEWKGNGMTEDGLLKAGQTSTEKFQSYTLHAEFRTPWMPASSGQSRGNSGIYHQSRYETQILDSFGLDGVDNECGGIYKIAPPMVNMCFPPLRWQTYDVDFTAGVFLETGETVTAPHITVKLNGVLIHDNVALPHSTGSAPEVKESDLPGPVHLQDHGNPVVFRNIWILRK